MKKTIFLIIIAIVIQSANSSAQNQGEENLMIAPNNWETFRSPEGHFRFLYPPDWNEQTPRGKNVKALVSNKKGLSSCNILTKPIPDGYLQEEFWQEMSFEYIVPPKAVLLDSGKTFIDNKEALFTLYDIVYRSFDLQVEMRLITVLSFNNNIGHVFTCGSKLDAFDTQEATFRTIIRTFVFENWDKSNDSKEINESNNSSKNLPDKLDKIKSIFKSDDTFSPENLDKIIENSEPLFDYNNPKHRELLHRRNSNWKILSVFSIIVILISFLVVIKRKKKS